MYFSGLRTIYRKMNQNMKQNVVKLNESQLKKIVAESVKKVLKESTDINNSDGDMSPEAVARRNYRSGLNPAQLELIRILKCLDESISAMSEVHYGNVNYQHTSFEREKERAMRALEELSKFRHKVSD